MKLLQKLLDLRLQLGIGIFLLLIGFVDVIFISNANSIKEMTWWGKSSIYLFFITLFNMTFMPLILWLINKYK